MEQAMIYILEDDEGIRELEAFTLKEAGYDVEEFGSYEAFSLRMRTRLPDLVLLDLMLPDGDGLSILKELKKNPKTAGIPVLLATAKSQDADVVAGLDLGADDYIPKPFHFQVLRSRVSAALRRVKPGKDVTVLKFSGIRMDLAARTCYVNDREIELNGKEYELTEFLLRNAGKTLTRDQLMDALWGYDYAGESRTLDTHMNKVRKKLAGAKARIQTVWGIGYKLDDQ